MPRLWTEKEINVLYEHRREGFDALQKRLPQRTKSAIKLKMNSLKIGVNKLNEEEKQYILDNFKEKTSREIAEDLGRASKTIVLNFLKQEGLSRVSDNWMSTSIESSLNNNGYAVKITYEMSDENV